MIELLYPLRFNPLFVLFITWFFVAPVLFNFGFAILGAAGLGISVLSFSKYAFAILDHSLHGRPGTPEVGPEIMTPLSDLRHIKLLTACGIYFGIGVLIYENVNYSMGLLWDSLILITLPAMIGILGIEHGLFSSLNPFKILKTIQRMEMTYAALTLLILSQISLVHFLAKNTTIASLLAFTALYSIQLTFRLVGLSFYKHRDELGMVADFTPEHNLADQEKARLELYNTVLQRAYSRRELDGYKLLIDFIDKTPEPILAFAWFFDHTLPWEKTHLPQHLAKTYIERLITMQRLPVALHVCITAMGKWPDFKPESAYQVMQLCKLAIEQNDYQSTRKLLVSFHTAFPESEYIGQAYTLLIQVALHQQDIALAQETFEYIKGKKKIMENFGATKIEKLQALIRSIRAIEV